ncbi:hypothetical protein ES703_51190 [subsurface metagenome]
MKLKDLNKGQKILIEEAKKKFMPDRLFEQIEEVCKGKNPFMKKEGIPPNIKQPSARVMNNIILDIGLFFTKKFGTFGIIYFQCIDLFGTYPQKKAEAKFRYFLGRWSKEKLWFKSAEMRKPGT